MNQSDYTLNAYAYELPSEQIAQYPDQFHGHDKLMVVDKSGQKPPFHSHFDEFASFLPPRALLVANNTRVAKCRLIGKRKSGGKSEFLLLTPLPLIENANNNMANVEGLLRPAAKTLIGEKIDFGYGLEFTLREKGLFGQCKGTLSWNGNLGEIIERHGTLPLPPYIRRKPAQMDNANYQTIYARNTGSAAAPTAGLHFTRQIRDQLLERGFEWAELTLHVGYGTFSPVRCQDIRQHKMHAEYVEIPADTATSIKLAKESGRSVVAIGTTSLRAMEGVYRSEGKISPFAGHINIFLYPGAKFHITDALLTNFHLPGSTLLMLVAAFAGRRHILRCYEEAVKANYRFFSYGDAMLIH